MNIRDTLSTELGVFDGFDPKLPESAVHAGYVLLANIDPQLQLNVLKQVKRPRLVAFDTMNHWIEGSREGVDAMLGKVDLVIVNEDEVNLLTGVQSAIDGARQLLGKGPKYVVVKKGEHGSVLVGKDMPPFLCPAFPIDNPVDPTGAGDTFAGAMIGYLATTGDLGPYNMRRSIVYGSVAASFTVEAFGLNRLISITTADLDGRYRQMQEMTEF